MTRTDPKPRPWFILRVSPNMERRVAEALGPKTRETPHGAGLAVYVPIEKYRPANHWKARTRPLIPGYIFADLPDDDALDLARENHAVREVMCREGRFLKVPAIQIGSLILFEACREFDRTYKVSGSRRGRRRGHRGTVHESRWEKGQRVRVKEGPFASFAAEVMRSDRADRVEVLVSIFGRVTPVELDEDWLEEFA